MPVAPGAAAWSHSGNWAGVVTPSPASGAIHFPALLTPACATQTPSATCYWSANDMNNVSISGATIDDGVPYNISGNQVALGAGGITAAPSANDTTGGSPYVSVPLKLTAPQTWSVSGGATNQQLALAGSITGSSNALTIALSDQAALSLYGDDEVGAVTVTGSGAPSTFAVGFPDNPASLNANTGNPVKISGGVKLVADPAATGPLAVTASSLQVGDAFTGGRLTVSGAVVVDSTSSVSMYIHRPGTRAGTDFSQLSATGNVNLGGASLDLGGQMILGEILSCPALTPGDVDTLVKTTGSLTGTFAGVPDGTTIPLDCPDGGLPAPMLRINYTATAVTATVVTSGGTPTATSLSASPADALTTNQSVTLSATVSADSSTTEPADSSRTVSADSIPSGTVEFDNNGTPIAGCLNRPLGRGENAGTATCQTAFGAASTGDAVTAVFRPMDGTDLQGSTDGTDLVVAKGSTTTTISVSDPAPTLAQAVTYAASVAPDPAGAVDPSGNVQFLDRGTSIDSCASQPLISGVSSPVATCTLSYAAVGSHQITAAYVGDDNFTGSMSSEAQTVTVEASPTPSGSGSPTSSGSGWPMSGGSPATQTATGATPVSPAAAPQCKLVLRTPRVLPAQAKRSSRSTTNAAVLKVSARCDQDTMVALHATITLLPDTGSRRGRVFPLEEPSAWLKAWRTRGISIRLPTPALVALKHGSRETAMLVLSAGSGGGTTRVLLRVPALKL